MVLPTTGAFSLIPQFLQFKKEFFTAINSCPKMGFYEFTLTPGIIDVMPFIWSEFDTQVGYTYVIPWSESVDWQGNISRQFRKKLIRARKEMQNYGCNIEMDVSFEQAHFLFCETANAKGFSLSLEKRMPYWWNIVQKRQAGRIYFMRDVQGKALCATAMVWDSRTAYYLLCGMLNEVRKKRPSISFLLSV